MTTPIAADPMVQLAVMMLDHDELQAKLDDENLRAARDEQHRALEQQVSLLHDAADDVRTGAFVESGLAMGGLTLSAVGQGLPKCASKLEVALTTGLGSVAQASSKPLGNLLGDAPKLDDQAAAKRAEANAADAQARAEEALHHRDRAVQAVDRTLDAAGSTLAAETQGNLAIIANV